MELRRPPRTGERSVAARHPGSDGKLDGGFFIIYTDQGPLTPAGYAGALAHARARSALIDAGRWRGNSAAIGPARDCHRCAPPQRGRQAHCLQIDREQLSAGRRCGAARRVLRCWRAHGRAGSFEEQPVRRQRHRNAALERAEPARAQWVAEMNRLGIVIDASHASDAAFDQLLELSKYPIILSHSSLRSANDHPRNLDEGRLRALAAKNGAMCVSTIFLSEMNMTPERAELFGMYERSRPLCPRPTGRPDPPSGVNSMAPSRCGWPISKLYDDGAARDRGRWAGSHLLRCRLGRWRRAGGH